MTRFRAVLALAVLSAPAVAGAETVSSDEFRLSTGPLSYVVEPRKLQLGWNPQGLGGADQFGMRVSFFGQGLRCESGAKNGPVIGDRAEIFRRAQDLTTIALDSARPELRWTPSGNTPACADRSAAGPAFIHVNNAETGRGIGLYAHAGTSGGAPQFWGAYDQSGSNGHGASKHIQGTFIVIRLPWRDAAAVLPWAAGTNAVATIWTVQGVGAYRVGNTRFALAGRPDRDEVIQVKQQLAVNFINKECVKTRDAVNPASCQIKYLFNTAVMRNGVVDWRNEKWFQVADVTFDPGQRGLAVVHGPIRAAGEPTLARGNRVPLYVSRGAPTQHEPFASRDFVMQISLPQLLNAVRLVAQKKGMDEAQLYGERWRDGATWALLSVTVGQEARNSTPNAEAYIGGGVREIYVGSRIPPGLRP